MGARPTQIEYRFIRRDYIWAEINIYGSITVHLKIDRYDLDPVD